MFIGYVVRQTLVERLCFTLSGKLDRAWARARRRFAGGGDSLPCRLLDRSIVAIEAVAMRSDARNQRGWGGDAWTGIGQMSPMSFQVGTPQYLNPDDIPF